MIRQTFHCNTGIPFSTAALAETGLDVHSPWPICKKLPRPQVGPMEDMVEQYKSSRLEPLNWRSHALEPVPRRYPDADAGNPEESDSDSEDERLALKGSWTPEQSEDYFDWFADIND